MPSNYVDVIVVGAGVAGVVAATQLAATGASVLLIEARERCGGRTCVIDDGFGHPWDVGGQWIGATHHKIRGIISELGISLQPQFDEGKHVLILHGKRQTYTGNISSLNSADIAELEKIVEKLDEMSAQIPLDAPYTAPLAKEWDAITLEQWQKQNIKDPKTITLMNFIVNTVLAVDASQTSLLFFLLYLRSGEGYNTLADIRGGAQQDKVIGGVQQISTKLGEKLGDRLILNSPVRKISQDNLGVTVHCDNKSYRAGYVIVTAPPSVVSMIEFSPPLPSTRVHLNQRMPQGLAIKLLILYDRPFWRDRGFSGEVLSDEGPAGLFYDATTHDGKQPALVGFIVANDAIKWSRKGYEAMEKAVIDQLVDIFGPDARHPKKFIYRDWAQEHWSKGCFVGIMPAGMLSQFGEDLRKPCGRIHWAGTETSDKWIGYIEGAALSGERAAWEVSELLKIKAKL